MNNENFQKLLRERTHNALLPLFEEFKQIEDYSLKLDFWSKHALGLELYYRGINKFSIIPSDSTEITKFIKWAIPFRDGLRNYIESQPLEKQARLRLNCKCEFGESFEFREQEFWRKYNLNSDPKAFAELEIKKYEESNRTRLLTYALAGQDVDFYKLVLYCFDESQMEYEILANHLPIGVAEWDKIDLVLRIREDRKYKVFLEQIKQKVALNQLTIRDNPKATQLQYALYYYYLQESGDCPRFGVDTTKEKGIEEIATRHGIGFKNFQIQYNKVSYPKTGREFRQKKSKDVAKVLEMLSDYPKAMNIARLDLDNLRNS